jgi:small-conductance mechanosensitive channel
MTYPNVFDHFVENNWQLVVALVVVIATMAIASRRIGSQPLATSFPRVSAIVTLALFPFAVVVVGSAIRVLAQFLDLEEIDQELRTATIFATTAVISLVVARCIEVFFLQRRSQSSGRHISGLWRGIYYGGCLVAGIAIYLKANGYSITGLWLSTGVVAALAGFALQRTLGDLFAGIALSIERPFQIGDWLEIDSDMTGQVVDVNWRATRLRGWDNATVVIPNSELAGRRFKNLHGETQHYSPWYLIKIPAEVDPRFAKALIMDAALRCAGVLKHPPPVIRMSDVSTQPYEYMVWVTFRNYPAMFAGREELFREIHHALKSSGIQIAPEVRELRVRKAQQSTSEPPTILLALKSLDVASEFTEDELKLLASSSEYLFFDAGTVILHEGAVAAGIDVIVTLVVDTSIATPDGVRRSVGKLRSGEYFGMTSMVTSEPIFVQITAETDVTVIRIGTECMRQIITGNPSHADNLAKIVKQRMDKVEQVRATCRQASRNLSIYEILRRIETTLTSDGRR